MFIVYVYNKEHSGRKNQKKSIPIQYNTIQFNKLQYKKLNKGNMFSPYLNNRPNTRDLTETGPSQTDVRYQKRICTRYKRRASRYLEGSRKAVQTDPNLK